MSRITRLITATVTVASIAALTIPIASAASGGNPNTAAEHFTVQYSFIDGVKVNDVFATGPVAMTRGTDQEVSNTVDYLSDGQGNTVEIDHAGFPTPIKDMQTCTLIVEKDNVWWAFKPGGGSRAWRDAQGSGVFTLRAMFGFKQVNGECSLALIPDSALAQLATLNASPYRQYVEFADIALRGSGTASVHP
jgi:hypothetical protein